MTSGPSGRCTAARRHQEAAIGIRQYKQSHISAFRSCELVLLGDHPQLTNIFVRSPQQLRDWQILKQDIFNECSLCPNVYM